jgi:tetratricopeptide (TPR) repeat protein
MTGSIEALIPAQERAIRLSPRDPAIVYWHAQIGIVHLLQSRIDEAILWFEKARSAAPALALVHARLASAYALKGESERAATELAEARRLQGEGSYSEHRPAEGRRVFRGAEGPRLVWSHLFGRPAQGRNAAADGLVPVTAPPPK